jgi:hypothetical protein
MANKPHVTDFITIIDQILGDDADDIYKKLEDGDFNLFIKVYEEELNNINEVNLILNISLQSCDSDITDDVHKYVTDVVYNHLVQDKECYKIFENEDE